MMTFYYAPWSRASGVRWLLEELGVPHVRKHIDIRAESGVPESYRAIQPNKKVPALEHDGVVVTERAAITIHLADAFPEAGLAPAIGDKARGPYLTACVYADAVVDPCVAARAHGLTYASNDYSFGLFDDMVHYLERMLTDHPYAVGHEFSAADTQIGTAIDFTMNNIKVLPERDVFHAYVERLKSRPAHQRAAAADQEEAMQLPFFQKMAAAGG